jgi:hypothetical protein
LYRRTAEYVSRPGSNGPVAGIIEKTMRKEITHGKGKIPDQIGMP